MFPNRFLRSKVGDKILNVTKSSYATVEDIRRLIEDGLEDTGVVRPALSNPSRTLPKKEERIAIRKMMGNYWSNSSPFALDLVGAVIRQGSFVEKMHSIDWSVTSSAMCDCSAKSNVQASFTSCHLHHGTSNRQVRAFLQADGITPGSPCRTHS